MFKTALLVTLGTLTLGNVVPGLPSDFAWGVATAAYQIEGAAAEDGRGPSIWDDFCKKNGTIHNGDNGDVADDFYHRYKEDVAMMKKMNVKNFRMSFSWSRILPGGTIDKGINGLGIAFYNYLIDELLAAGITPWVTLHHWDTPSGVHNDTDTGSFLSKDIIDKFAAYADLCFGLYGDRVKHWITLNEPWTYTWVGYGVGGFAPGRCSSERCKELGGGGNSSTEPYMVTHNMILSHAKAVQVYRQKYQKQQGGVIGMANNVDFMVPFNTSDPEDVAAANR
jgi:beta-glucosidase